VLVQYQLIGYESLPSNATVLAALSREINAFKDHPASERAAAAACTTTPARL
jgi:hypothetical protein